MLRRVIFFGEIGRPFSNSLRFFSSGKLSDGGLRRGSIAKTECFLSSDPLNSGWFRPRKFDNLGLSDSHDQSEYRLGTRTHADYKSEPYEIPGSQRDSINSSDVSTEAVLLGGDVKNQWWDQQFPKRWVIVLLCFFAFLLCNMDRVSQF